MTLEEQKKALRGETRAAVNSLEKQYTEKADCDIFGLLTGLSEYRDASTVFCFVGTSEEINTVPILEDALHSGKRVGVPKCVVRGIMEVREIKSMGDLAAGAYGILEPGDQCPVIDPKEIDLAVVPCMTCSSDGRRLGYGGGFYDRYLERTGAVKAVICRERIMRENIPVDSHDKVMDIVISEKGIRRTGKLYM